MVSSQSDQVHSSLLDESHPQIKKFRKELNTGTVSLVLLSVLAGADEELYGYQIAKQLEQAADGHPIMKQGALYPVLRSMSASGLLESRVEPSYSGPPRRYYAITPTGREVLRQWQTAWRRTQDFVDAIIAAEEIR